MFINVLMAPNKASVSIKSCTNDKCENYYTRYKICNYVISTRKIKGDELCVNAHKYLQIDLESMPNANPFH